MNSPVKQEIERGSRGLVRPLGTMGIATTRHALSRIFYQRQEGPLTLMREESPGALGWHSSAAPPPAIPAETAAHRG